MSHNQVVFTGSTEARKFTEVTQGPVPTINDNQILFKAVAYAANPTDWKHVVYGIGKKGDVVGFDASGIVEKVGNNVKGFEVGDVVSTFMHGNISPVRGAFSEHVVADPVTTVKYNKSQIKDTVLPEGTASSDYINTFEAAASVTLSLATSSASFSNSFKPSYNKSENANKSILIWGGSTSTGVFAIQIAKLVYGLKVITTASKANHEFLTQLGADHVFDYKDPNVIEDIKKVANGSIVYACDTVSVVETYQQSYDATAGSPQVILDNLLFLNGDSIKTDPSRKVNFTHTFVSLTDGGSHGYKGQSFKGDAEYIQNFNHLWQEVLPEVIPKFKTPHLKVLPRGLESANEALSLVYENKVSAEKVVFRA